MNATAVPGLPVSRCERCHGRFLPRPRPCPRCGSVQVAADTIPPLGEVLAATELFAPPTGWSAPLRIALIGLAEEVRVLAGVVGELPPVGTLVTVERSGEGYVLRNPGVTPPKDGRGEGESPGRGSPRPL